MMLSLPSAASRQHPARRRLVGMRLVVVVVVLAFVVFASPLQTDAFSPGATKVVNNAPTSWCRTTTCATTSHRFRQHLNQQQQQKPLEQKSYNNFARMIYSAAAAPRHQLLLRASASDDDDNNDNTNKNDQLVLGIYGSLTALVMMYSEFVLSQTGCGLPAGPLGLFGAVEGISYLSVVALAGYSLYQKATTGSGLPAGKYGLLGLAEGLSFLALLAGVIVLGLQITNYGYIPNAVPMEGGMCQ